MKNKDGGVVLLEEKHFKMFNQSGKPVVGWKDNSQGLGIHNLMGFALVRVVVQKESDKPLYDQPLLIENAGSIVIVIPELTALLFRN